MFPWAQDYLAVYEKFGLAGRRCVMAHNVHATDSELMRMAAAGSSVAHCPWSNAMLGSGLFPMRRHLRAGVRVALGTDVGGGTGFGMPKEALEAYAMQRVSPEGGPLEGILGRAEGMEQSLAALFTLAGPESVVETVLGGVAVRGASGM
jgi:guanine deaminase